MRRVLPGALVGILGLLAFAGSARADDKDIEYVAEHLPEVAMDNRYATLPVWQSATGPQAAPRRALGIGYSDTRSGELQLDGPTLAASWSWSVASRWSLTAFGFYDRLAFSGRDDQRPLRTLAVPAAPLPLLAPARFDSLGGHLEHVGLGIAAATTRDGRRLGLHRWVFGLQYEEARLDGYGFAWRILSGPGTDSSGRIGFDADYRHVTPFAGIEWPRSRGRWTYSPHALVAVPVPRRGVFTQVSGPGFALAGDTGSAGRGKHFGDPSLALGIDLTHEPLGLSIDLGAALTQATLERAVHRGIDSNLSVQFLWRF